MINLKFEFPLKYQTLLIDFIKESILTTNVQTEAELYAIYSEYFKSRYIIGSKTTPYSSSTSKRNLHGDSNDFNIDTGNLFKDATENFTIKKDGFEANNTLSYASYALSYFEKKGGLAPYGLYHIDDFSLEKIAYRQLEVYIDALS